MTRSIETLIAEMQKNPDLSRQIIRGNKTGKLSETLRRTGFELNDSEISQLEAMLATAAAKPLSEDDLARVSGAGEGDYFAWLDSVFEGA